MDKTLAAKVQCTSDNQFLQRLFSIQSTILIWELSRIFQHEGICNIQSFFLKAKNAPYAGLAPAESRCEVPVQSLFHPQKGTELHGGKG